MRNWRDIFSSDPFDLASGLSIRVRAKLVGLARGIYFHKLGRLVKIRGPNNIKLGKNVSAGDFCWIEAISYYAGRRYTPRLEICDGVSLSHLSHISCVGHVRIGKNCLVGSKVYIGDHSHGSPSNVLEIFATPPANRHLDDIEPIDIGENSWICDGAIILAGTRLAMGSIVGANSVVKMQSNRPAIIAGVPARIIRYLD
jgi:acetyltransferase-like isoleucine patch superfamily enzyme